MINIKNLDPNKIKIDEKSYNNFLIYYTGYVTSNSVKPLYLILNEINGYTEESNGNKYLTLVSTDESKGTLRKSEELRRKMRECIRSIDNYLHDSKLNTRMKNFQIFPDFWILCQYTSISRFIFLIIFKSPYTC